MVFAIGTVECKVGKVPLGDIEAAKALDLKARWVDAHKSMD
jgi:hypothetical protein